MKKLMLLAAMLALVVVAASPAFAQSGTQIEVEEGEVEISDTTAVEGSIAQNCPASVTFGDENVNEQVVTTGQQTNIVIDGDENEAEIAQELVQSGFSPEVATECTQEIAQAAAAGGGKAEAKAGGAEAKAGGANAELPKTGGGASLLALGAGALLVGSGLVARRMIK